MSSLVLRRLAITCRPIYNRRTFATSAPLSDDASNKTADTTNAADAPRTITLIPGDGIGPEISRSVQQIFEAADVPLKWEAVDVTPVKSVRVNLSYTFSTEPFPVF